MGKMVDGLPTSTDTLSLGNTALLLLGVFHPTSLIHGESTEKSRENHNCLLFFMPSRQAAKEQHKEWNFSPAFERRNVTVREGPYQYKYCPDAGILLTVLCEVVYTKKMSVLRHLKVCFVLLFKQILCVGLVPPGYGAGEVDVMGLDTRQSTVVCGRCT